MALVGPYEQLSVAGVEGEGGQRQGGRARSWRPVCDGTDDFCMNGFLTFMVQMTLPSIKHTVSSHLEEASLPPLSALLPGHMLIVQRTSLLPLSLFKAYLTC